MGVDFHHHGAGAFRPDRQEGGRTNLKAAGINLVSILKLDQIATYLMSAGHIPEDAYRRTMEYIEAHNGDA